MKVTITPHAGTHELTITIQGLNGEDREQASFSAGAGQVGDGLQLLGHEGSGRLRRSKAVAPPTRTVAGETYYRQAAAPGHDQTLSGAVVLSRPLDPTSAGGAPLCPLARACQWRFGGAPPLRAAGGSFTLARTPAGEVVQDWAKSHGVSLSAPYLHHLAQHVGQRAVEKGYVVRFL